MPIVPPRGPHPFAKPRIIIGYGRPPTPKPPAVPADEGPDGNPIKGPEKDR